MAEYSFPHTSVDGDRVVSADMWRAANRSLGMDGWAYGLDATRTSPTGATFTISAGALALDGVVYIADDAVTVTGTLASGTNAIIAKFGTDRDIVLAHVLDYANSAPEYDHILLYLDIQSGTFTLTDKRADSLITPLKNRAGEVLNFNIASGVDASKLTTGTLPTARIASGSISRGQIANKALQAGLITNVGTFEVDTTYSRTITFATPFDAAPSVVATIHSTSTRAWEGPVVESVSASSFRIYYKRLASSGPNTVSISWIATPRTQTNNY